MRVCVSKEYPKKKLFENLELEIPDNRILCVLGESGAGKTTLLNILAGLTAYEGYVQPKVSQTAYIFQTARLLPHLTAKENLLYTANETVTEEKIDETLEQFELKEFSDRKAYKLSGGEKQRVAMARAFLSSAELLLMDEPFSSLDIALKLRLIGTFAKAWEKDKKTTVFVTHDIEEALMLSNRIVVLKNGKITSEFEVGRKEFPSKYGEMNELRTRVLRSLCIDEKGE